MEAIQKIFTCKDVSKKVFKSRFFVAF